MSVLAKAVLLGGKESMGDIPGVGALKVVNGLWVNYVYSLVKGPSSNCMLETLETFLLQSIKSMDSHLCMCRIIFIFSVK